MKDFSFAEYEAKWQQYWEENNTFRADETSGKPKYYVLEMFPYPSGKGLHVGHPLGYVAGDIHARYKRHKGYEVLHPMGFDAFGLPAEQHAIETGVHPAQSTEENIQRYKQQLRIMGLSYDWQRELRTSDPEYYKWTQWIFLQLFNSWFNQKSNKAEDISTLEAHLNEHGTNGLQASETEPVQLSADEWKALTEASRQEVLMNYRLAYLSYSEVNWCEALGTVLANDEVINGHSERGGHPVTKKRMRQWFLRITAYADRLLSGLEGLDWSDSMKEMQRNWIGRSEGAELRFGIDGISEHITVFTTRPDTIFGCTFMVVAPESELVELVTTADHKQEIEEYIEYVQSRSERERLSDVKRVTGAFTGAYAIHPFSGRKIPIWISEYVLASYGTGAIMAVPAHDSRDHAFAKKFGLPIQEVVQGGDIDKEAFDAKHGTLVNSDFLDGLQVNEAIKRAIEEVESKKLGTKRVNFRLRDAGFSRQRYWGEPFPIEYRGNMPYGISEDQLPLTLPDVESYKPTGTGDSPIAAVKEWVNPSKGVTRETDTMPGYAGSSWYWLRYMSPGFKDGFVDRDAEKYWRSVDFYNGGSEHAVGHLLYSRLWQKALFDLGYVSEDEPFKKMVNQGMIQGTSKLIYRVTDDSPHDKVVFVSKGLKDQYKTDPIHVDVNLVNAQDELDTQAYLAQRSDGMKVEFLLEEGKMVCGTEVEKMSKRWLNVVNPDDVISKYGADAFRMYEMFLGPITDSKPWNTHGIDGVYKFLRKLWNLFWDQDGSFSISEEQASKAELKVLHMAIKRITDDIERLSFNTCVSSFMICVNELGGLKCNKRVVLEPLLILISPFAPHISEELWQSLGHDKSISTEPYPIHNPAHLEDDEIEYPVSVNGKMRAKLKLPADADQQQAQAKALEMEEVKKWTEGKQVKKFIFVPKRIINVVVG